MEFRRVLFRALKSLAFGHPQIVIPESPRERTEPGPTGRRAALPHHGAAGGFRSRALPRPLRNDEEWGSVIAAAARRARPAPTLVIPESPRERTAPGATARRAALPDRKSTRLNSSH